MKRKELEERLIDFAVLIIELAESNKKNYAGNHLSGQMIRSGTSAPLNYGEAQSAESKRDFLHKMQIVLKELRETHVCLKIINKADLNTNTQKLEYALKENDELISIFVISVKTAKSNK
jgi:four helix bundle protein